MDSPQQLGEQATAGWDVADSGESFREQMSRVHQMADGDLTWDLSDNDIAALRAVLRSYHELLDIARRAAVYFADTDAPLGIAARAAAIKAEGR